MYELKEHPSRLDGYGSIWRGEHRLGYCQVGNTEPMPVTLRKLVSESEQEQIREFVEREAGPVSTIAMPPSQAKVRRLRTKGKKVSRK